MPIRECKLRAGQPRHSPLNFAARQFDAAKFGLRRMAAAAAVDAAVDVDRSVPMTFEPLLSRVRIVLPDAVVSAGFEFEQAAAGAVALGDQDLVADDDGVRRVDAFADTGSPRIKKLDFSARRVET